MRCQMKRENLESAKQIFALTILLSRKWEVIVNRNYAPDDLTVKQLMMLIVMTMFESDPTIKEVAHTLATSHQNVKAIALQLEKKGFIQLYKDPEDGRVRRIRVADGKEEYWKAREVKDNTLLEKMFEDVDMNALTPMLKALNQLDEKAKTLLEF